MSEFDYDLVVLGSGPSGQKAAIQAAKLGKRAAVIEHTQVVGSACINTGTIPSKTLREAAMHLSGYQERSIYGASYAVKRDITMSDLFYRTEHVIANEIDVTRHQLQRNGVDLISAEGSLADAHTIRLQDTAGRGSREITTENILIAVGTETTKDSHIEFDGKQIFTSDDLLHLPALPKSLAVVGAGVIGLEYATIFAALGVRVTLIDMRPRLLTFVDAEIIDTLVYQMRQNRMTLRLGEGVSGLEKFTDDRGERVRINLESGKKLVADNVLYSVGRTGCTGTLGLDKVGIEIEDRGLISVDENYQTVVPNIYAVGDVIGFPSLASTSMEQGRHASCHAFGVDPGNKGTALPYGIYTIPEISVVGKTEEDLTEAGIPYEVGKASYREISRGQIIGDSVGMLKLCFHMETRELLGVSILGEGATELIHIGQVVLQLGGTIDYFVNTVFNYPTLAECYKTAAFDGINRMR
jgi:NAD(P) transhydrogenase